MSLLHTFAEKGNIQKIQEFLNSHASDQSFDVNASDGRDGFTPLHYAAANGQHTCISTLIVAGADPNNATNKYGTTPLHEATRAGHRDCIQALIEGGANANMKDAEGWSPLHYGALDDKKLENISILINAGADVNATNVLGQTPLHIAASRGLLDAMIGLVQRGADLAVKDSRGQTAFSLVPIIDRQPENVPQLSERTGKLANDLKTLYLSKEFCDITFKLKDGVLIGHKNILSARSSHFKEKFQQTPDVLQIEYNDINTVAMEGVLEWMYTGNIESLKVNDAPPEELTLAFEILFIANQFELLDLKKLCEAVIMNIMEYGQLHWDIMGDIHAFIRVANSEGTAPFTMFCSQHIVKNFNSIVDSDIYSTLHKNTINKIIQELSMEKKLDENKPASRPPSLVGESDTVPPLEGKNLRSCKSIVSKLMKDSYAFPFNEPVDPVKLSIPDYFDIIKHPMDFLTIKNNLEKNRYHSLSEFVADMRLVFQNALTYNPKGSTVANWAENLKEKFEQRMAQTSWEKGTAVGKMSKVKTPPSQKSPNIPVVPTTKKRKADSDVTSGNLPASGTNGNKRQLSNTPTAAKAPPVKKEPESSFTFEEKKKIGESMNKLTSEQLLRAVEIISESKKYSDKQLDNDEDETIYIDMNEVDDGTLRKLARFISSCLSQQEGEEPDDGNISV